MTTNYWSSLLKELERQADYESSLNLLRRFTRLQTKEIHPDLPSLFEELTALAEAVLRGSYEVSLKEMLKSRDPPRGPFAIVAMGKFGGRELTYGSDLDIIYLLEEKNDQEFYSRLGARIISALTLLTREGYAWRIDTSLRPSGNGGTLVSTLAAFQEYHQTMGRTWERQALIKARPVVGDNDFILKLNRCLEEIVYEGKPAIRDEMAREIHRLRMRMEKELAHEKEGRYNLKTGRGGIIDIEFIVQYLQILHGRRYPTLRTPSTVPAIRELGQLAILDGKVMRQLEEGYLFYRGIETHLRRVMERPTDELNEDQEAVKSIIPRYLQVREEIRALYERIFHDPETF